jgi:hypothetical protein
MTKPTTTVFVLATAFLLGSIAVAIAGIVGQL